MIVMMKPSFALLSLLMAAGLTGCGSQPPITTPTSFEQWNAKDGTFRIDYPSGWEANGGGRNSIQWARITNGNAEIHVEVKFSDSALADVMGAGGGMMGGALGVDQSDLPAPVDAIHAAKQEEVAQEFSNYAEVGEPEAFRPFLGDGRRSEFTATKGLVKLRGYRATILSNDRGIRVVCRCDESDWPVLQPVYVDILNKMTRGSKQI
jgi:hypothetical protein